MDDNIWSTDDGIWYSEETNRLIEKVIRRRELEEEETDISRFFGTTSPYYRYAKKVKRKKKEYKGDFVFQRINNGKIHICKDDQFGKKSGKPFGNTKYLCGNILVHVDERINLPFDIIGKKEFCQRCLKSALKSGELTIPTKLDRLFDDLIEDL